jgi:hypothetical protein
MDKIEPELLRNGAVVNLLSVIGRHHNMLSVIELLERKFAFKEVDYAIGQGVIAFNSIRKDPAHTFGDVLTATMLLNGTLLRKPLYSETIRNSF